MTGHWEVSERSANDATLITRHTCGHTTRMFYAGAEFAKNDGPKQAAQKCTLCRVDDRIAAREKSDGNV